MVSWKEGSMRDLQSGFMNKKREWEQISRESEPKAGHTLLEKAFNTLDRLTFEMLVG